MTNDIYIDFDAHDELMDEATETCGLAFTLYVALDSGQYSDNFTEAARILSGKTAALVNRLKALEAGQEATI